MLVILVGTLVAWRLKLEVGSKALKLVACSLELDACGPDQDARSHFPRRV